MGAEHIPVQLEPLFLVGLPWPPGELELIELILGFSEATHKKYMARSSSKLMNKSVGRCTWSGSSQPK